MWSIHVVPNNGEPHAWPGKSNIERKNARRGLEYHAKNF